MIRTDAATVALIVAMSSAQALQDVTPEPGRRYRVTGVEAGDALNVRERPDAGSGRVGELAREARDVIVTGRRTETDGSVWWEIAHPNAPVGSGWVNARFLTPQDADGARERDYPLQCVGTEPFWSLEISDGAARFASPDGERPAWNAGRWREAVGSPEDFAVRLESPDGIGYAAILRAYDFYSDGMSDLQHPFAILLVRPDGEALSGCCARAR